MSKESGEGQWGYNNGVTVRVESRGRYYNFQISATQLGYLEPEQIEHIVAASVYKTFLEFNKDEIKHAKELYELKGRLHNLASRPGRLLRSEDLVDILYTRNTGERHE